MCDKCEAVLTNYFDENELKSLEELFIKNNYKLCINNITCNAISQVEEYFSDKYKCVNDDVLVFDLDFDVKRDDFLEKCENFNHSILNLEVINCSDDRSFKHFAVERCNYCNEELVDCFNQKQLEKIHDNILNNTRRWYFIHNVTYNAARQLEFYLRSVYKDDHLGSIVIRIFEEKEGLSLIHI